MPLLITKAPAAACQHANTGLACTEGYFCMADDEAFKNPRALTCVSDSEESDEDRELQRYFKIVGV